MQLPIPGPELTFSPHVAVYAIKYLSVIPKGRIPMVDDGFACIGQSHLKSELRKQVIIFQVGIVHSMPEIVVQPWPKEIAKPLQPLHFRYFSESTMKLDCWAIS